MEKGSQFMGAAQSWWKAYNCDKETIDSRHGVLEKHCIKLQKQNH